MAHKTHRACYNNIPGKYILILHLPKHFNFGWRYKQEENLEKHFCFYFLKFLPFLWLLFQKCLTIWQTLTTTFYLDFLVFLLFFWEGFLYSRIDQTLKFIEYDLVNKMIITYLLDYLIAHNFFAVCTGAVSCWKKRDEKISIH